MSRRQYAVTVAGLGLIGGSIAKAVKKFTPHTVSGYDRSAKVLQKALSDQGIDAVTEDFSRADILLIALYPEDTIAFLEKYVQTFRPDSVIIDLCGVKRCVCEAASRIFRDSEAVFIGGHPMAGLASFGYENATAQLFEGASMILTPFPKTPEALLKRASDFFLSLGFGHIEITTPEYHDQMIAYTSQLAHIVSSAYMQSLRTDDCFGFSAGSWKDLTRVAKLNEEMWTQLFLCNKEALIEQLDVFLEKLLRFRHCLAEDKEGSLREWLRQGREKKERLENNLL